MVEFAVVFPFLVLLVIGSFATGMVMDRHLVVSQLVRNAGNMYARGIDFASTVNKQVLLRSASGLNIQTAGGQGVVYLSLVVKAPPGSGANQNQPVIAQRFVVGNTAIAASRLGTPPVNANGSVPNFFNDLNARATLPAAISAGLGPNQRVFVAEVEYEPTELQFAPIVAPNRMYSRAFF